MSASNRAWLPNGATAALSVALAASSACSSAGPAAPASDAGSAVDAPALADASCEGGCAGVACIGNVTWGPPAQPSYAVAVTVLGSGQSPVGQATVEVCATTNGCSPPLSTATTDDTGQVVRSVPSSASGFDAYFRISDSRFYTTVLFVTYADPASALAKAPSPVLAHVLTQDDLQALAQGTPLTLGAGTLLFTVVDCAGQPLSGVSVSASTATASSVTVYLGADGKPVAHAVHTTSAGRGAILNLSTGRSTVTATLGATRVGAATVFVEPLATTELTLSPTP